MKIKLTEQDIKTIVRKVLAESNEEYINAALDKMKQVGGYNQLDDLSKLALLGGSGNYEKLKKLNFSNIFKENGGTFGKFNIKVKIKPIDEQTVDHEFSKICANKEGYLYPYIDYDRDSGVGYVSVRFDEFIPNKEYKGGGKYNEYPIIINNMFPIDYDYINPDFVKHQNKVDNERKEFLNNFGLEDDDKPEDLFN